MKKSYIIFLFISLFAKLTLSQNTGLEKAFEGHGSHLEWTWQNPYPQGNDLFSVKFVGNYGWSVGKYGTIIRTSNNGLNWTLQKSNTNRKLNSIYCIDQFNVWIVGNNGEILKTSNGGNNWSEQNSGSIEDLYSVCFVNSLTGWAVGDTNIVLKTTNGGINWVNQQTGFDNGTFYSVFFINSDTGWVAGSYNSVLITINGGENWTTQLVSTSNSPLYSIILHNGFLLAAGNGFYKSTNFGNNWININLNMTEPIIAFDFVNSDTAYGIGGFDSFIRTTNGGNNWNFLPGPNVFKTSICFQGVSGHFVGEDGIIYFTTNGGSSWSSQSNNLFYTLHSVFFTNSFTGWAVGSPCSGCNDGVMLKTTDGGNNWIDKSDTVSTNFHDVFFIDQNTGWTCGYKERIMKTTNGGDNWLVQYLSINGSITSIYFYDHNTGWASGYAGRLLRTTDGGSNWTRYLGLNSELLSLHFINQNTGWVVGSYGRAYRTTNGGLNWSQKMLGITSWLSSIFFISSSTGWITGEGLTLKTTNGGENWFNQPSGLLSFYLSGISFANENEGYAVGRDKNEHAVIIHTTNGGTMWEYSDNGPSNSLYDIFYNSSSRIFYTAGEKGTILKSEDSIITNEHENVSVLIADGFHLSQNYPNPFNPTTIINFDLPSGVQDSPPASLDEREAGQTLASRSGSNVKLIIYNLLGVEVAVLVNEKLTAGSYEVEFDGTNFPSGIYFYSLKFDEKIVDTRRMTLLK